MSQLDWKISAIVLRDGLSDTERYERKSAFLAVSKQFTLPSIHHITGHIGIGNHRFVEDIGMSQVLNGVFFGISKDFHPAFARGNLTFSVEVDGRGVNTGLRHTAASGLQIYLACRGVKRAGDRWKGNPVFGGCFLDEPRIDETDRGSQTLGKTSRAACKSSEEDNQRKQANNTNGHRVI